MYIDCGRTYCSLTTLLWIEQMKWKEYWENLQQAWVFSFLTSISLDAGFFFFFFMSFIFTILWRIVAFVVVWLLGCCIFPFAFNSFAVDQVEPRFYTLVSQLDTKKLSCVVWAGCWNNELIYKLWYWKIRREKDFWKLTYLNIIISWWSLNGILEETIHIMMFNFMLAVMNGFLITH